MSIFNEVNRELETKPLAQSYRATPRLTNFFNFIARACFHGGEHSPEYQELFTTLGSEPSTVSFDLVMNGKEDDEAREEMPLIIPRIAEMQEKGIELGNMAILLDSRAELAELVKALIDASIPFEVLSGSGFFETPEVRSVTAFMIFSMTREMTWRYTPFFDHHSLASLTETSTRYRAMREKTCTVNSRSITATYTKCWRDTGTWWTERVSLNC